VRWDTDTRTDEKFPLTTRFGLGIRPLDANLAVGLDYEKRQNREGLFHAGIEVGLLSWVGFRLGYNNGTIAGGGYVAVPMGGNLFQTDYSIGEDPIDKTYVHRFSLLMRFSAANMIEPKIKDIRPGDVNGYLNLMIPPPMAKVTKLVKELPSYALINIGTDDGVVQGMIFGIYRLQSFGNEKDSQKLLIGRVEAVRVEEKFTAVRVKEMIEGFLIGLGDVITQIDEVKN